MSAQNKLLELSERRAKIISGDENGVLRQKDKGKLTARERLVQLFDEGSFVEIGAFVTQRPTEYSSDKDAPEAVVTGYGAVDGRLVYAFAQDNAENSGAVGEMHAKKMVKTIELAVKTGAPVMMLFDSDGARLNEGVDALWGYTSVLEKMAAASGVVPLISVVMGLCSGAGALISGGCDVTVMTKNAQMFLTAPIILKSAFSEDVDGLASAEGAMAAGNIHFIAQDDLDALNQARNLLSYLPSNNLEAVGTVETDNPDRTSEAFNGLDEITGNLPYIVSETVDAGTLLIAQAGYADEMLTGFARLNGEAVGVIANNGDLSAIGAMKASRHIALCDSFHLPIITFIDVENFRMQAKEEAIGNVRALSRLAGAYVRATSPKVCTIVGRAFGSAAVAMTAGSDITYAWPGAAIGLLPAPTAAEVLYRETMNTDGDLAANRAALEQNYINDVCAPYAAAKRGYIDDIIEPATTRQYLAAALSILSGKRVTSPARKHANMPL